MKNNIQIKGAFVIGYFIQGKDVSREYPVLIKLSSINVIHEFPKRDNFCVVEINEGQCYEIDTEVKELRKAIDSFIFHQETHWEKYGD